MCRVADPCVDLLGMMDGDSVRRYGVDERAEERGHGREVADARAQVEAALELAVDDAAVRVAGGSSRACA